MKYMVMECHPGYAVVMDEDGRFSKVANRQYEVGQLLTQVTPMQPPRRKPQKWVYSLVAAVACLALLITAVLSLGGAPYASVYVKINPEVRIDVDKNDRVIGLEGINADGIALIENYDYRNKDLNLVTDELVDLAVSAGYLQSNGRITLTLDSEDQVWITDHSQTLSEHVHRHLQDRFTVTVEISLHHGDHHDGSSAEPPKTDVPTAAGSESDCEDSYNDDDWDDDGDDDEDDDDGDDDEDDDDGDDDHHWDHHDDD